MRRALLLIAMMSLLAVVLTAQPTAIQSPNGGEVWKKGEFRQIKFASDQTSGFVSLVLVRVAASAPTASLNRTGYTELGQIGTVRLYPNTPSYSFNWEVGRLTNGAASPGRGYKVLIKIAMPSTTITDASDSPFVIGAPPTIDMFAINDGRVSTEERRVTLNYRFSGFPIPSKYRVRFSQSPGTLDTWSTWIALPTGSWPIFELPDKPGDYSIGLVLANDLGESPMKGDAIRYAPVIPQKDYTINAATLACGGFPDMNPAWYSCRCTSFTMTKPSASNCYCTSTGAIVVKSRWLGRARRWNTNFSGAGNSIPAGRSYRSITRMSLARNRAGSAVLIMPQAGSQNILFKVRLWTGHIMGAR